MTESGRIYHTGIYALINGVSDARYIGASDKVEYRVKDHLSHLRCNNHPNKALQADWNEYGESAFRVEVIRYASHHTELEALEAECIAEAPSQGIHLYNSNRKTFYRRTIGWYRP